MRKIVLIIGLVTFFAVMLVTSCSAPGGPGGTGTGGTGGGTVIGGFTIPAGGLSQEEQRKPLDPNDTAQTLFAKGSYGSQYFRIPALIVTKSGVVLAATDARYNATADLGKGNVIDVLVRRSEDLGNTWSEPIKVGPGATSVASSYGDAFLMNAHNGDVIMGVIWNPGIQSSPGGETVLYRSSDDGKTWTESYRFGGGSQIFTQHHAAKGFGASGQGLTLRHGANAGQNRLMFAFFQWNTAAGTNGLSVSAIRSDDDGYTWRNIGNVKPSDNNIDETKAIELANGDIMFNHRRGVSAGQRSWSKSINGGVTWTYQGIDPEVLDPGNNADFARYELNGKRIKGAEYALMINANVVKNGSWFTARKNHYIRLTKNDFNGGVGNGPGKYAYAKQLVNGGENLFSGYPTIITLPDGSIGTLTEETTTTLQDSYDIVWRRFNLNWLTDGAESVDYANDFAFQNN